MPSLAEIKTMSVDMLARERAAATERSETTPASLSDALITFCSILSPEKPEFIQVIDDPHGLYAWCSDGVSEKMKVDGGHHAFGWTIWEWPKVMWTAEFHDVWRSPNGELRDITPKPGRETSILFVTAPQFPQTFNFDDRPGNRRQRIYEAPCKATLSAEAISRMKPAQRQYELRRAEKAGVSLADWVERKFSDDPLPALIDAMIFACGEHERYFDTLGTSGMINADEKLLTLLKRRIECQEVLYQELKIRGLKTSRKLLY